MYVYNMVPFRLVHGRVHAASTGCTRLIDAAAMSIVSFVLSFFFFAVHLLFMAPLFLAMPIAMRWEMQRRSLRGQMEGATAMVDRYPHRSIQVYRLSVL